MPWSDCQFDCHCARVARYTYTFSWWRKFEIVAFSFYPILCLIILLSLFLIDFYVISSSHSHSLLTTANFLWCARTWVNSNLRCFFFVTMRSWWTIKDEFLKCSRTFGKFFILFAFDEKLLPSLFSAEYFKHGLVQWWWP